MRLSPTTPALPLIALPLALGLASPALADDATLDIGVPPWPGVTVKSEMASQLLAPLGYETRTHDVGLQVVYQGLETGDIDALLGGWMPAQQKMFAPREESGVIEGLVNNVEGAQMTLAVPDYLHDQGITSFADLDAHREAFDGKIHSFGAGSAASDRLYQAIDDDAWGLGDWEVVDTSVIGMLGAASSAIDREAPIVWVGWTPHWMNLALPMRYLDDPKDLFGEDNGATDVLTVLRSDYGDAHPNLERFFEQFTFAAEEQSWMIQQFGEEEREVEAVARQWLQEHPERVAAMLEGVTTSDGDPAWPAVQASL
ncbi:Glycine betaine-binding protein OpuAC precursor [Halomonas sp. THAF12]|uniref:glycine betaine ABC transporter substrate-binding protein n=1 Tax=Halomonas TaxID=2745 RepID=UPI000307DF29|nr:MULTISPECIES: glycine betaine ABC transporter substrate-binding protein [Halomonas]QFT83926.1 Glycine betaine-binding protein OpuAC precursor [Halomonas sp. THAF12]